MSTTTAGLFAGGLITMTSGLNAGISREVKSYVPGQITLALPFPFPLAIGDTYAVSQGCEKTFAACKAYDNVVNFRGEPYLPGIDDVLQVGRAE